MIRWFLMAAAIAVAGCSTTTAPEARNVTLHEQMATLCKGCTQLGTVSTEVSLWKMPTIDAGHDQARDNLRADAYRRYQADAVVVENMNTQVTEIMARGVALKCAG